MSDLKVFSKTIPRDYFLFPIRLICKMPSFTIANDIQFCEMDDQLKADLLKIQSAKYDEEGELLSFMPLPGCPLQNSLETPFIFPFIELADELCSSNFVVQVPSPESAKWVNLSLKLVAPTSPSLYIGYSNDRKSGSVINPPGFYSKNALTITTDTVAELSGLLSAVISLGEDAKFRLMTEKFLYATSFGLGDGNRFLELAIILEMLLLPKAGQELSYRFSLRMAHLITNHLGENIQNAFAVAKKIYKIRSDLVHSGQASEVRNVFPKTLEYTRQLLCLYLSNPQLFTEKALDDLCLG